ncbi:phage terminase large subunit family protein [Methylobacterium planeticum]|uniref:Phage terminase large subunit family protein n=2 Tax=Methylobacterium planeticum TaxID=2615211 RepID=A0A6N6MH87_9HYPH|nr:phage terminase large subunit family protein [Methylobacterium planeticum]
MKPLHERRQGASFQKLRPPPRLPLSQWIERHMRLPEGLAAKPGPVRLWPFQKEIADAITDPMLERVTVRKCVRVGYTTLLTGATASYVANEPAPLLTLLPTEDDCRNYIVSDLEPIFDATPSVAGILSTAADETGRNTIRHRRFPGGSLKIVAARSPRNLRAHTVRILLIDEEDAMEVTNEGDALDLAIKRTLSFPNRKIIRGSTPTDADTSTICREYEASDRRVYEIRCVECSEFAEPKWSQIEWEKDRDAQGTVITHRPKTASWACPNCGVLIPERYKAEMVANGRWRATKPEVEGHAGFALSALISPHVNASWSALAAEYIEIHDDPDRLRTFRNTLLGEAWSESVDVTTPDALATRAEAFGLNVQTPDGEALDLPEAVLLLTCGVDVQPDRLEAVVYGWDRGGNAYALGHFVIWGNTLEGHVWRELDELLLQRWKHPLGAKVGIEATCVDSSDGGTVEAVYAFCWPRLSRGVMAIKGMWGRRPVVEQSKGKISGGAASGKGRLWIVGVDEIKQILLTKLARYPDQIRFSASLPMSWFAQLCSERRVVRRVAGRPVRKFERIRNEAAEALDATVYAFAARYTMRTVNFDARVARLSGEAEAGPAKPVRSAGPRVTLAHDPYL